jgi:hypothetical protein
MTVRNGMKVCMHCDAEYEPASKGGIMLNVCDECRADADSLPPSQITTAGGIIFPNPDFAPARKQMWERVTKRRNENLARTREG